MDMILVLKTVITGMGTTGVMDLSCNVLIKKLLIFKHFITKILLHCF